MSNQEQIDRCRLYLLDEMSADQQQAFELQMQSSPELLRSLAAQSELLADLGDAIGVAVQPSAMPLPVANSSRTGTLRVASLLAALAATVLFVIYNGTPMPTPQTTTTSSQSVDVTLVAQVWAQNRLAFSNTSDPETTLDAIPLDFDQDSELKELPSWLTLGVANLERKIEPNGSEGASDEQG